ncbi:MAG TPA: hypothetical protein VFN20_13660 [Candidatus Acidoferrum sp.]|nr:hypothetical protein [Candidatus Acidoferrum sp.]
MTALLPWSAVKSATDKHGAKSPTSAQTDPFLVCGKGGGHAIAALS